MGEEQGQRRLYLRIALVCVIDEGEALLVRQTRDLTELPRRRKKNGARNQQEESGRGSTSAWAVG